MNNQAEVLTEKVGETVGQTIDVYPMMTLCALDIICETTMGVQINAQNHSKSEYVNAVHQTSELAFRRMSTPWLYTDWVYEMTPSGKLWKRNLDILHGFSKSIIQERKQQMKAMSEGCVKRQLWTK